MDITTYLLTQTSEFGPIIRPEDPPLHIVELDLFDDLNPSSEKRIAKTASFTILAAFIIFFMIFV